MKSVQTDMVATSEIDLSTTEIDTWNTTVATEIKLRM